MGLNYSYAILPAIMFITAGLIVWNYPLSRERQSRIRSAIDRREDRRSELAELRPRDG